MEHDPVMGLEFEYAIVGTDGSHNTGTCCRRLMQLARNTLVCVPGSNRQGLWVSNGCRIYEDYGNHPEVASGEVNNPTDCVCFALAGDAILRDLIMEMRSQGDMVEIYKTNVDYASKSGTTWAGHESFQNWVDPEILPRNLLPLFVARPCFGAGGLNPFQPGIEFVLSARLLNFDTDISEGTTNARGIYNTRNRPLGEGSRRMHVIVGETSHSHLALWLRVATTALVTTLTELGLEPGKAVTLRNPVKALQSFTRDPSFTAKAQTVDGLYVGCLDIQRHYLEMAEDNIGHERMPSWAEEGVQRWRSALDTLEQRNGSWTMDWQVKRDLYADQLQSSGIDLATLPVWNRVLHAVCNRHLDELRYPLDANQLLASNSPAAASVKDFTPSLESSGLAWDQLETLLAARHELCSLDMTFHQIAPDPGLHAALDLRRDHQICDPADIKKAQTEPPTGTRAHARGLAIREIYDVEECTADWCSVRNPSQRKVMRLTRAELSEGTWEEIRDTPNPEDASLRVRVLYNRGDLRGTVNLIRQQFNEHGVSTFFIPYLVWSESRMGNVTEALRLLGSHPTSDCAVDYVSVHRFRGLRPRVADLQQWLRLCERQEAANHLSTCSIVNVHGHHGYVLGRNGDFETAEAKLRHALDHADLSGNHRRIESRVIADLADIRRIRGDHEEAAALLERALRIYQTFDFGGERAESWVATWVKLNHLRVDVLPKLRRARSLLRRFGCWNGLARNLAIEARLTTTRRTANARRNELNVVRDECDDLRNCPLLTEIIENWDEWAWSEEERYGDYFWLV